jgi:uncharacterized protein (DUF1697 family)
LARIVERGYIWKMMGGREMHEYVSLLRGVNVGGKVVRMENVAELYRSMGLWDVRTYIQSGNVLFNTSEKDIPRLAAELQAGMKNRFSIDVTVIIRSRRELTSVVDRNPYVKRGLESKVLYVTFLAEKPAAMALRSLPVDENTPDRYEAIGREVYLWCPGGYGKTVYSNCYFEKHVKVGSTTRNWNTVTNLLDIAGGRT